MNLNGNWKLKIRERIWKDIARFPRKDRQRIIKIIEEDLVSNPYSGDIEKMEGEENSWRRRIGAYRIFYEIYSQEKTVYVYRVKRRTSKTY